MTKDMMRKTMVAMLTMMFVMIAVANDVAFVFSTRGPDRYADGTPVMEGEMYALVWTRNGFEFQGFDMDGKTIDSKNNALAVALPRGRYSKAVNGVRCQPTLFQLTEDFANDHADGTFALVLLDTRVSDGKGGLKPAGRLDQLKGWGMVEKSSIRAAAGSGLLTAMNLGGKNGVSTTTASKVPEGADIPQPRITNIKVQDGLVHLTVKGTSSRILYNVDAHDRPGHRVCRRATTARQGLDRAERELEFVFPAQPGQNFFKVSQN